MRFLISQISCFLLVLLLASGAHAAPNNAEEYKRAYNDQIVFVVSFVTLYCFTNHSEDKTVLHQCFKMNTGWSDEQISQLLSRSNLSKGERR